MKRGSTLFLQTIIVLIGIGVFVFMLWEPHLEGRNVNATLFEIYFNDPFLAYAYTASIAFFMALYQAFRVVGFARNMTLFSPTTTKAVRMIKYCALSLVGLVTAPLAYLFIVRPGDDIAGGVAMGLMIIFLSIIVAAVADVFEGTVRSAVDKKTD